MISVPLPTKDEPYCCGAFSAFGRNPPAAGSGRTPVDVEHNDRAADEVSSTKKSRFSLISLPRLPVTSYAVQVMYHWHDLGFLLVSNVFNSSISLHNTRCHCNQMLKRCVNRVAP